MQRWFFLLFAGMLATMTLFADVNKGKRFYLKHMKSKVEMNGADFAALHTCDEWKMLFKDDGKAFIETFGAQYPKHSDFFRSKRFKKKMPDLADFVMEYASDTGKTPTCGAEVPDKPDEALAPAEMSEHKLF